MKRPQQNQKSEKGLKIFNMQKSCLRSQQRKRGKKEALLKLSICVCSCNAADDVERRGEANAVNGKRKREERYMTIKRRKRGTTQPHLWWWMSFHFLDLPIFLLLFVLVCRVVPRQEEEARNRVSLCFGSGRILPSQSTAQAKAWIIVDRDSGET